MALCFSFSLKDDCGKHVGCRLLMLSLLHDQEALRRLKRRLSSRARAPVSLRMRLLSVAQSACLKLPFRAPRGPPDPLAPPCIRQRARPFTAACRQGSALVLAPHRGLWPYSRAGAQRQPDAWGRRHFWPCLLSWSFFRGGGHTFFLLSIGAHVRDAIEIISFPQERSEAEA
jgi:hypothetical protein